MNRKALIRDTAVAFAAQGIAMILSVIQTLIIPKFIGTIQFGYLQLFLFYASYANLFRFGLNDGIYLIHGGETRDRIDKKSVRAQYLFGLTVEAVVSLILIALGMVSQTGERKIVFFATAAYMLFDYSVAFCAYLYQAMNETRKYSAATIIDRITYLIILTFLFAQGCDDWRLYLIYYLASRLVQMIYCLYFFRDFLHAGQLPVSKAADLSAKSALVGIKLMLAIISSQLIIGIPRFFVDVNIGIESFGQFSLSVSISNFFLAFISQASMVLFPALRQAREEELGTFFEKTSEALDLMLPIGYLLYFPIAALLRAWLPDYTMSVSYLAFLLPACLFDCKMNLIGMTYLKVLREENRLLCINVIAVGSCFVGCAALANAPHSLNSIYYIALLTSVVIALRACYADRYLSKVLNKNPSNAYLACVSLLFLLSIIYFSETVAFSAIALSLLACSIHRRKQLKKIVKTFSPHFKDAKNGTEEGAK